MIKFHPALAIIFLSIFLASCGTEGLYRLTLITEGEHVFQQDVSGDLILLGGSVNLPAGTVLDGSAHILSGRLNVEGQITGDVSFINGHLTIDPSARVGGNLNLGGESYHLSPLARIEGKVNMGTGVSLPNLPEQSIPNGWTLLLRGLISGLLVGATAVFLSRFAPGTVERINEAAVRHCLVSGAMGLLVGVVGISLLVTLAYTILLIPVTLLGLCLMGLGVIYGWIGLGISVGRFGARIMNLPVKPAATAFFGTLVFMLGLELLTAIPVIGGLIGISLASIGLGAVSLTRFGLRRFVPAPVNVEN